MALIDEKIALFKAEVGDRELNVEQKRVFNAFTKKKGASTYINVTDMDGKSLRIKIYSNKVSTGSQHILKNHYATKIHWVTAWEILNFYEVVEFGTHYVSNGYIVYRIEKYCGDVKISTVLKFVEDNGVAVLKCFYSDRGDNK